MDKIWIIQSGSRYQKKFTIYREESKMAKERDSQLRSVLGELSKKEQFTLEFVNLYERIAPVGKEFKKRISWHESVDTSTKEQMLIKLRKFQTEPKELARILINEKSYFIEQVSDSVEWFVALLRVHNFRDHLTGHKRWNSETKKYEVVDNTSEQLRSNFKLAKKQLKRI